MTSPQGLAEQILPARGAAQKATASFAEQLTDSPGRSDIESPSPSNPFREPAYKTKSVKYRYSGSGKHLSSPLKGSPSSPERKPGRSRQVKQASFTPVQSHTAKPKVLAVATTSRKRKVSALSLREKDVPHSGSSSPLSSVPTTPTVSTNDLPPSTAKQSTPDPPKRPLVLKSFSVRPLGPAASSSSVLSQPLTIKRKQKNGKNAEKGLGIWNIGNSVWILVNQSGVLVDSQSNHKLSECLMWWPARVVQQEPLRVSMFGDFPSSSSTSKGLCTIFAPSSSNVQPIHDDGGAMRFSRTTFRPTLSTGGDVSPPTKKQRLDEGATIEAKWESAVQCMEKASTLEQDGLPALLSSYATTGGAFYDSLDDSDADMSDFPQSLSQRASSSRKRSKKTGSTRKPNPQRSTVDLRDDVSVDTPRSCSVCPPDPTLQIPGELVFALAPRTRGCYWPAQILEHVPSRKEKYKVKFLDDAEHVIARDRFWTSGEEEFVRCTLGEWESAVKIMDDLESGDEREEYGADDDVNGEDATSALPPPPPEDFGDLSVRAQLAYVKPVLRAILNKEYAPAREKHDAFIKGGQGRAALLKSAGVRGGLDARFVSAIQKAICKWVIGDGALRPEGSNTKDVTSGTSGAEGTGGTEGETAVQAGDPDAIPPETLPPHPIEDNKMVGIEGADVPKDLRVDGNDNAEDGALLLSASDKQDEVVQDSKMTVDGHEQQPASLPSPANSVLLSPAVQQASLAPKSQLDQLLAAVSQAVATEPSLLPFHPELPRLRVDLLNAPCKDASQPSPLTPIPDEDSQIPPLNNVLVVCDEFETLSSVEKLDYCLNILLPECIQQLLLWRSGERTSSAPLSPEEEQRLHDVGVRKAAETDWVDDVMRLRAAQARLWGIDLNKKVEERKIEVIQGGTRSRPRRGTASRP